MRRRAIPLGHPAAASPFPPWVLALQADVDEWYDGRPAPADAMPSAHWPQICADRARDAAVRAWAVEHGYTSREIWAARRAVPYERLHAGADQ